MSKTISMDYSEFQSMLTDKEKLESKIEDWELFMQRLEDILLSVKEKELKKKSNVSLTRAQIFERVELLVNKLSDKDYQEAVNKWEKKLA